MLWSNGKINRTLEKHGDMMTRDYEPEPIEIPIDGVLDLHTFNPRDVKELLPDYLAECKNRGIYEVRIIHGKGTGILRETVHSILRKMPDVESFGLAGEDAGGWGATVVRLKRE
jgi:DNA-nicking Smr family endonuclease